MRTARRNVIWSLHVVVLIALLGGTIPAAWGQDPREATPGRALEIDQQLSQLREAVARDPGLHWQPPFRLSGAVRALGVAVRHHTAGNREETALGILIDLIGEEGSNVVVERLLANPQNLRMLISLHLRGANARVREYAQRLLEAISHDPTINAGIAGLVGEYLDTQIALWLTPAHEIDAADLSKNVEALLEFLQAYSPPPTPPRQANEVERLTAILFERLAWSGILERLMWHHPDGRVRERAWRIAGDLLRIHPSILRVALVPDGEWPIAVERLQKQMLNYIALQTGLRATAATLDLLLPVMVAGIRLNRLTAWPLGVRPLAPISYSVSYEVMRSAVRDAGRNVAALAALWAECRIDSRHFDADEIIRLAGVLADHIEQVRWLMEDRRAVVYVLDFAAVAHLTEDRQVEEFFRPGELDHSELAGLMAWLVEEFVQNPDARSEALRAIVPTDQLSVLNSAPAALHPALVQLVSHHGTTVAPSWQLLAGLTTAGRGMGPELTPAQAMALSR